MLSKISCVMAFRWNFGCSCANQIKP
uniref:Uncharacterized protein n=1 Tax=Rhizophora mucronata TaxID=61149 RepID=A0A2P2NV17_RHIMU